jgi:carbamoyl-phosphate synthase / aspartate carbamoyltransferase
MPLQVNTSHPRADDPLPDRPSSAAAVDPGFGHSGLPSRSKLRMTNSGGTVVEPASGPLTDQGKLVCLQLEDGTVYQGHSFGAEKSVAGELVFQTGMVGYPESITDPSYQGQILVITFPLVGNYGVPSRTIADEFLRDLPKYFESREIHIAGLVTASYSGEDFSHFLAESSLGKWMQENGVPGMYGVDTRALTKRIREEGSMLGRLLVQKSEGDTGMLDGHATPNGEINGVASKNWRSSFEDIPWVDPNVKNLVAEGEFIVELTP